MRTVTSRVLLLGLLVLLAGCASSGMRPVPATAVAKAPPPGKAAVVFMRPSALGGAIAASVFDLGPAGDRFVAIVRMHKQVVHVVDPGSRRFMVVSEAADFLEANLAADRTYYVVVAPRMGWWKARFSLRPVHRADLDGQEFKDWRAACEFVVSTPEAEAWAQQHWVDIQEKKAAYLPKWEARTDVPRLLPEDGR